MSSIHEYHSLANKDSIRVLILAPGEGNEPLCGDLNIIHLSNPGQNLRSAQGEQKPHETSSEASVTRCAVDIPYEAISYVWGSEHKDHVIFLRGKTRHITANLSDALHQCRLPDQPRVLWADSICINQDDKVEKNHQVYMMGRIYASSQGTLICLGTDPDNRDHARNALAMITDVNKMIQETFQRPGFSWGLGSFPRPFPDDMLVNDSRWQSMDILIRNPWFLRGWVVQEAALGFEAHILWAGCKIALLDLMRAEMWYFRRAQELLVDKPHRQLWATALFWKIFFYHRKAEARVFSLKESYVKDPGILHALSDARVLSLSDPRDKIYAFMALPFVRNPMPALEPNYEQSDLEVCQDFAIKYLEETSDLNLLCYVSHKKLNGVSLDSNLGSSWIPRWDREERDTGADLTPTDETKSAFISAQSAEFLILHGGNGAPASLQVRALIFDSIRLISRQFQDSVTIEEFATIWSLFKSQAGSALGRDESSPAYDSLAFLEASTAECCTRVTREEWAVILTSYLSFLQNNGQDSGSQMSPESLEACHRSFMSLNQDRHIFILERGYYGLGPSASKQGDVCAFVFGVRRPLILRKTPDEGAFHYTLIGPAFVVSKRLDDRGLPPALHQRKDWENWNELCEREGWADWGLAEERIILL